MEARLGTVRLAWTHRLLAITLRAEYNDPTFLRNHLAMESFRELIRLPAPRSRHVNLRVNGSVFGVMLELERHGGKWLERNDRDRSQSLYEAERSPVQGGLMPMPDPASYVLIDDDLMYNKKSGDSESYGDLISLIEDVLWEDFLASPSRSETSIERTGEAVDTDTHVSYLALMALLQSRDHVASNYHVGFQRGADGSPRWEVYPTDLDTTFGCVYSDALGTNLCNDLEHEVWWLNGVAPYEGEVGYPSPVWMNLLIHLVLNEPACGDALDQRICAMLASDWWTDGLPRRIDATAEMLRDAVGADPNDLSGDLAAFDASIEDMKAFLPERRAWLESQLLCP